ncbi:hypothetical protein FB565_004604 [Actinoplanes lutulentus]|uniref:Ig-like domain-containing protein n=1 Tax=Actinoplanes lutulentus TaxID=1287878 RepID=A0A327ZEH6_9ACTN|nr:Ig-like domain-containing protein [Actinoplanes lutulentus]MBB2944871.1 hypothetical protein [Actinoplanes lutulentus]RAK35337.1 hypothetical protein B0I29_11089 [Actinoplanes lutulentus]
MRVLTFALVTSLLAGAFAAPAAAAETSRTKIDAVTAVPTAEVVSPDWYKRVRSGPITVVVRGSADVVSASVNDVVMSKVPGTLDWSATVPVTATTRGFFGVAYDEEGNAAAFRSYILVDDDGPGFDAPFSPAAGERIRGDFRAWASKVYDDGPVVKAELWVNGKYYGSDNPEPPYNQAGFSVLVRPGTYSGNLKLTWKVSDELGNSTSRSWNVIADNTGPTGTVNPKQNTRVRGTFTTTLTGVKDLSRVAWTELWADGKYIGMDQKAPYSGKVKTGKKNGAVKLTWKLFDELGNSRTYTRTVVADNKAPTVKITKAPKNKAKVKGTVKVYVKATDSSGIARVELIINGKVVAKDVKSGYFLSVNTKNQKKTMKVRVRAYDKLGNVTYTTTRTWRR